MYLTVVHGQSVFHAAGTISMEMQNLLLINSSMKRTNRKINYIPNPLEQINGVFDEKGNYGKSWKRQKYLDIILHGESEL